MLFEFGIAAPAQSKRSASALPLTNGTVIPEGFHRIAYGCRVSGYRKRRAREQESRRDSVEQCAAVRNLAPNISLVPFDPVFGQQLPKLVLKSADSMMFDLLLDVAAYLVHPCPIDRKGPVSSLPSEFGKCGAALLYPC